MTLDIPVLDFTNWGEAQTAYKRQKVMTSLDQGIQDYGVFILQSHPVPPSMLRELRESSRRFFDLPVSSKTKYKVKTLNGNGWGGLGSVTASLSNDVQAPPDLHEYFRIGPATRTADRDLDEYYPANQWPAELPSFCTQLASYSRLMNSLSMKVLAILAQTLSLPSCFFDDKTERATWQAGMNWYPPAAHIGVVQSGQYRISEHSDFGTITLLSRPPGVADLQIRLPGGGWENVYCSEEQFIVFIGDMLERWTDGRWHAPVHRIPPPAATLPDDELISLIFFFEANPDVYIDPLLAPRGGGCGFSPVKAGDYLLQKVYEVTPGAMPPGTEN